ncbi:MAG: ABC transporter ATP-binding protein [Methanoregula sp.]|nr:ABC transporter ATP-binding protein [Methanoregula sp.]
MIRIERLTKKFNGAEILKEIDLEIRDGEIFTFIGPSGSGKTTILRLIDLLDLPTTGRIFFDGQDCVVSASRQLPIRRRMGMVFQKPSVLNATVAENVAFGLKFRGIAQQEIHKKVFEALGMVGLPDFADRRAPTLSGGEMQRVAIARAMVTEPEVLILDEPTANLDPVSSDLIEDLIIHINKKFRTTIVMSTHDMIQGQRLADRMGVIMNGQLVQIGSPGEIFYQPAGGEIARFVGSDVILGGLVTENREGHALIRVGDTSLEALTPVKAGQRVMLFIRPEDVSLTRADAYPGKSSVRNQFTGRITKIIPSGPFVRASVDCGFLLNALITRRSCTELGLTVGTTVVTGVKATAIHVVPDRDGITAGC